MWDKRAKISKAWMIAIIPGMLAIFILVFVVALFIIKLAWSWVVPDLFPGAVSQGLIASTIGWYTAFKLALILAIISSMVKAKS
ncbi:MAG: hypothetical protein KGH64_00150 [Candidatus Micrarchaeota archaeon]|nr:hypothetical protein [Candidatus Micrarchaeota archaeon]MDE1860000.1 hypothetical protein [Candidatus Micrarchaeota archaeon]